MYVAWECHAACFRVKPHEPWRKRGVTVASSLRRNRGVTVASLRRNRGFTAPGTMAPRVDRAQRGTRRNQSSGRRCRRSCGMRMAEARSVVRWLNRSEHWRVLHTQGHWAASLRVIRTHSRRVTAGDARLREDHDGRHCGIAVARSTITDSSGDASLAHRLYAAARPPLRVTSQ